MLLREPIVIVLLVIVAVFLPLTANADGVFGASKHDIEKTLFLIVEATQENTPALSDLEFCLSCVSNYINPYWFNQFVLISFDASGIRSADGFFTTDDARVALESILKNPLPSNNGSDLPLLESVIHGLSSFTFNPQSVVYLITTAGSSVSDQVNGPTFFKALLGWQVQLQYILVNSTQSNHTLSTQSTRFVADLAVTTGGNFIGLTTPFEMTNFINAHLPTLYDSAFIGDATQGSFSCVQTTYYTAIEANVGTVYLYVYSNSVDPSVRSKYNIISLKWLFDDIYARIYSFTPVDGPGIYTVSLSDIGPCSLQIRSQSAPEATATTQIPTKSTTTGSTQSVPSNSPATDTTTIETTSAIITESTPSGSTSSDTAATVSAITESTFSTTSGYYDAEFDVIFVLDIHRTSSPMILINFLNNTLLNFNLNGKIYLAVNGLCVYDPIEMYFIPIRSPSDIEYGWSILYDVCKPFTNQSNLAGVLGELYNLEYSGYRPNINNHLIVYTTINGTAESDAIAIGNETINSGTYSIVVVTSESNENNIPSLTALVGGKSECVITTNDWTTTAAEKLANLIWKASNNNGIYC